VKKVRKVRASTHQFSPIGVKNTALPACAPGWNPKGKPVSMGDLSPDLQQVTPCVALPLTAGMETGLYSGFPMVKSNLPCA
jgi:hypothetical protein